MAEVLGKKDKKGKVNFSFEITKWEKSSADEVIISGNFSGVLGGVLATKDIQVTNGTFTNVKVKVFNTKH
ncbi:MAG: hypothetical protein HC854_02515 [Flavobacterium sp.]|nr:hypothetical protein [Flavobacterium sp.]